MNAVRLRIDAVQYEANPAYRALVKKIVHQANQFQLLAILDTNADLADPFRDNPNIFFAVSDPKMLPARCFRATDLAFAISPLGAAIGGPASPFNFVWPVQGRRTTRSVPNAAQCGGSPVRFLRRG